MITVVGCWENKWMEHPRTERTLWKQSLRAFNVDRWKMVPDNGADFSFPQQYDSIEDALAYSKGERVFVMCPHTRVGTDLKDFDHPDDVVYIFGNTQWNLLSRLNADDKVVNLQTPCSSDMFGHSVLTAVLYDRLAKS